MQHPHNASTFAGIETAFAWSVSTAALARALADHADVEGCPGVAIELRGLAERETGLANGLVNFMVEAPGKLADSASVVVHFVSDVLPESAKMFAGLANKARDEGQDEVADWMNRLAAAQHDHRQALLALPMPSTNTGDAPADRSRDSSDASDPQSSKDNLDEIGCVDEMDRDEVAGGSCPAHSSS